jgi:hypothetical protein
MNFLPSIGSAEDFQRFPVSTNQSDALMATLNEGQGQQTQFFKNHPEQDITKSHFFINLFCLKIIFFNFSRLRL